MARAPGVRRSCFDEASAFAITRERRLARIDGLPHLSETGGAACGASKRAFVQLAGEKKAMSRRFFRAPDSREPPNIPSGRIKFSDSPPRTLQASFCIHP